MSVRLSAILVRCSIDAFLTEQVVLSRAAEAAFSLLQGLLGFLALTFTLLLLSLSLLAALPSLRTHGIPFDHDVGRTRDCVLSVGNYQRPRRPPPPAGRGLATFTLSVLPPWSLPSSGAMA